MLLPCWSRRILAKPSILGQYQLLRRGYVDEPKPISNRDIWKTKREKFMRNILGLVKHGKVGNYNDKLFAKWLSI